MTESQQGKAAALRERVSKFIRTASGQFVAALVVMAVVVTGIWMGLKARFYRNAVPPEIELTLGLPTTGSSLSLWEILVPMRLEACGGAIFGLAGTAASDIQNRGLAFFQQARQGRGYSEPNDVRYYRHSYKPWQETPLSPEWTNNGAWLGLSCMGLWPSQLKSIIGAARAPGSFYTTGRQNMLLVSPDLKLVVYTYAD